MSALETNPSYELSRTESESASEFINQTEISGFNETGLLGQSELTQELHETIPPSHLEGCPSISYEPRHPLFTQYPGMAGFYEVGSHCIRIGDHDEHELGREGLLHTVTHEIGHNVHAGIQTEQPEVASRWETINQNSWNEHQQSGFGFVSEYAMTNMEEDFAESYACYARDPELLQVMSPEKYEFMRDYVFAGREHAPAVLAYWEQSSYSGTYYERRPDGTYTGDWSR